MASTSRTPTPRTRSKISGRRASLAALGLGLLFAFALLAGVDVALGSLDARSQPQRVFSGGTRVPDDLLGYRFLPNLEESASLRINGETLWTATYRTNAHGWREVPEPVREEKRQQCLLFFGCSYTFGHGVEDGQTLPARTAALLPQYRVYNFGGIGYGPQQMLALLESGELTGQIAEASGTAVFVFLWDHLARALGTMRTVVRWTSHFPYYAYEEPGIAVRKGNFDTARPALHRLYHLLHRSGTVRYAKLDFPLGFSEADYALVAAMMRQSKEILARDHQIRRFAVVLYPTAAQHAGVVEQFRRAVQDAGVEVLDYRDCFDPDAPGYQIHGGYDTHPTAQAYADLADRMAPDLATAGE